MVPTKGKGKVKDSPGDEFRTPKWVWQPWDTALGGFTLDAAASAGNSICQWYLSKANAQRDAFACDWLALSDGAGAIWCNPPYARAAGPLFKWVTKALFEAARGATVCMLLPADTSTNWFSLLWDRLNSRWVDGVQGYFLEDRVHFIDPRTNRPTKGSPNFGSLIVVMRKPLSQRIVSP